MDNPGQAGRDLHGRGLGAGDPRGTRPPNVAEKREFVAPRLTRHEPLTRITLVSGNDFPGSGGSGGTFFG
jgi:hypothetical protein